MKSPEWLSRALLERMMRDARKRGAQVFGISPFTRGDKFKSLVFTVLSARTRDEATLTACRKLFSRFGDSRELAKAGPNEVQKLIYGVGFHRAKARRIIALAEKLNSHFRGKVPPDFDSLVSLPGVGRKTANVVLAHAFGKPAIGVDVHVHRISNRLGLVRTKKPEETERRLVKIVPKSLHSIFNLALVSHGQTTCLPRIPRCSRCALSPYCRRIGVKGSS